MFEDKYKSEMNEIKVPREVKNKIKEKLINASQEGCKIKIKKYKYIKYAVVAVMTLIICGLGIYFYILTIPKVVEKPEIIEKEEPKDEEQQPPKTQEVVPETPKGKELPILAVEGLMNDGMGFGGIMAYEIEELADGNPWIEGADIKTLPVFTNITKNNRGVIEGGLSKEEMKSIGEDYIKKFQDTVVSIDTNETYVTIQGSKTEIQVEKTGTITIWLKTLKKLPSGEDFKHRAESTEIAMETTKLLIDYFSNILSFSDPRINVFSHYNYDGSRVYEYQCYEGKGTLEEQMLNYTYKKVAFYPDDLGNIMGMRIFNQDLNSIIGEYPISTVKEAKELLLQGTYLTSVPEAFPGEEYVKKVELTYYNSIYSETLMPFYKYYVELPSMKQENGLKTFGIYYVPAVEPEYLKELPRAEIHFN